MYKFLFFILIALNADASLYKGQKEYVKKCVICHKGGQTFITSKTQDEWLSVFVNNGSKLAKLHILRKDTKKSHEYFKSNRYKKVSRHLKQFLVEYAKDSGKIPACN
ncbi:MAG: cytochrome C [Sulfurimonas sp.]|nr:MAG: cytochrome C [Sulfurimonas sp.]